MKCFILFAFRFCFFEIGFLIKEPLLDEWLPYKEIRRKSCQEIRCWLICVINAPCL